jgi:hypothetical protein
MPQKMRTLGNSQKNIHNFLSRKGIPARQRTSPQRISFWGPSPVCSSGKAAARLLLYSQRKMVLQKSQN